MSGQAGIRIAATLIGICLMSMTDKGMSPGTNWKGIQMMITLSKNGLRDGEKARQDFLGLMH